MTSNKQRSPRRPGATQTPMPSVKLDLGKYVSVRVRKDGTARVLFEVPPRLRPPDWPSTIPLPIEERTGNLQDGAEVARIQQDAAALFDRLQAVRLGLNAKTAPRTLSTLYDAWRRTQQYKGLKPRTQRGYDKSWLHIAAWSEVHKHPDPTGLRKGDVEAFLALLDDTPTTRRHVKVVLKMIMDQAIDMGWRLDNPVGRIKMSAPDTQVTIWEQGDVETYAWAAIAIGQSDMAKLLLMEWEIGQRLTDAYLFRYGEEYDPVRGVFAFRQGKTASKVTVRVSERLQAMLDHRSADRLHLFHDARFNRPFARLIAGRLEADDIAAAKVFAQVRALAVKAGARMLKLKELRHSCVVQLARSECTVPEIVSITGHKISSAEQILQKYLPRDSQVAENAQRKRGLVNILETKSLTGSR